MFEKFHFIRFPRPNLNINHNYKLSSSDLKFLNLNNVDKLNQNLEFFFNNLNSNKYKVDFGACSMHSTIHPDLLKSYYFTSLLKYL